jgi:hypothetical protein
MYVGGKLKDPALGGNDDFRLMIRHALSMDSV